MRGLSLLIDFVSEEEEKELAALAASQPAPETAPQQHG